MAIVDLLPARMRPGNPATLEDTLAELCRYGAPRLSMIRGGWYASIEMHVSATGAEFNVASQFDHPTPSAAAEQCLERVRAALAGMKP